MGVLDLEPQLAFYRKYHSDQVNVIIHMIFVPLILFSSLSLASNIKIPFFSSPTQFGIYGNLGIISSIGYGVFYSLLDPLFGIPSFAVLFLITVKETEQLASTPSLCNTVATAIFLIGWIVQFIGHGVFEKRAPALLDNLVQALVLAPFFVLFEFASLFGVRKQVLERVDAQIKPELEAFHAARLNRKHKQ